MTRATDEEREIRRRYERARDRYGGLSGLERIRVLDLVSERTGQQVGPEAEGAFADAVDQVEAERHSNPYGYGGPAT